MCDLCKSGCYNMCPNIWFNRCLAKYCVHPADFCHKLPSNVYLEEGAMVYSLALGCQACWKSELIYPSQNVLILGSNEIAVAAAICAKSMGADQVCMACDNAENLKFLKDELMVADQIVVTDSTKRFQNILQQIFCSLGTWPNVVINCAVCRRTMNTAVASLKPCGVCVLAGINTECADFNVMDVVMKNIKIVPSFRSANM